MPSYGYSLMCELYDPNELLAQAGRAEAAGFDFLTISDHFHPWLFSHHHSPYAWSVLGALAAQTERVELVSLVTCPTIRYHPAIVAQKAATVAVMSGGRFRLGLGAGENRNGRHPPARRPDTGVRRRGKAPLWAARTFRGRRRGTRASTRARVVPFQHRRLEGAVRAPQPRGKRFLRPHFQTGPRYYRVERFPRSPLRRSTASVARASNACAAPRAGPLYLPRTVPVSASLAACRG
jgi:alkanesulfonate monooxygenase SsuD/methylene tetrahydromethanopterin reductase-like flavin-dependent oxidoreductase (luciferase family)